MRHDFITGAVTSGASRMQMAAATGALIAPAGVAHARPPHRPGALGGAIALTAIATTTDQHLGPAAGTQEQAARGLHRRSPANAEDEADARLDGCAMAATLRATQSAVRRSRRLLVDWVQARLRLHFAGLRRRRACGLFSDPFPIRRGGALRNPGTAPRPASATSPSWGNTVFRHPYGRSCRSILPRARCRQIYAVLESHRHLASRILRSC